MESSGLVSRRVISIMTEDDLVNILEWAAKEGWNPGRQDAKPFRMADCEGFFVAKTNEVGEPVAGISAVRYGEQYGFIGLYICAPAYRGRGHGMAVFLHAMSHLEGRVIGLDAVAAQQANYAKQGFILAHQTVRFGGELTVGASRSSPPAAAKNGKDDDGARHGLVIQAVTQEEEDLVDLASAYDDEHVPAPRREFTRAWLTAPGHIARVAIKDGVVKGYGVLRPCVIEGAKIAPLFASSMDVAELLARALVAASVSSRACSAPAKVFLDVPEPNSEGVLLAERLGLGKMWETGRMYRGPAPKLPLNRVFGVTSLELG